jgi:DNA-binding NtrC family response regulator
MTPNSLPATADGALLQHGRQKILIVDDMAANVKLLRDALQPQGYELLVATGGKAALRIAASTLPDLILLDILMPEMDGYQVCRALKQQAATQDIPVIFVTAKGDTASVVRGFEAGGVDYIPKPFEHPEVLARVQAHLDKAQLLKALQEKNRVLTAEIARRQQAEAARDLAEEARQTADERFALLSQQEVVRWGLGSGFVGKSTTLAPILQQVRQLQQVSTTSVLIQGESGTGKELIARAIHFGGTRATGPFIPLNCATIPRDLAESTLFGHVRGAFTGAHQSCKGYFELAHGGTLFLDEIGDMPLELQVKLLRILEDGCILPLGGTHARRVDVRIVAATNADLQAKIAAGTFRQDLYFRLARFLVNVPPLRQRREDIPLLAHHFLELLAQEMGKEHAAFSHSALLALAAYHYPGNIRELKNIIEHALIISGSGVIQPEHLHFIDRTPPPATRAATAGAEAAAWPIVCVPHPDEARIVAYLQTHHSMSNAECRSLLHVDLHRASYLLRKLERAGVLTCQGGHRGARYTLAKFVTHSEFLPNSQ